MWILRDFILTLDILEREDWSFHIVGVSKKGSSVTITTSVPIKSVEFISNLWVGLH